MLTCTTRETARELSHQIVVPSASCDLDQRECQNVVYIEGIRGGTRDSPLVSKSDGRKSADVWKPEEEATSARQTQ